MTRTPDHLDTKLARLRQGERLRVLDLFSGCGGLSLGFQRAGFEILAGVEKDKAAASNHALNLHRGQPPELIAKLGLARDITALEPAAFLRELGLDDHRAAVDVVVGGPPCQAYARVGRAKLRQVKESPEAFQLDSRGTLYEHYLRFVASLQPLALLMENVPDVLNYGGRNVAEEIAENLEDLGYVVRYTLLNAASFGVPQLRERFFLLAYHERLGLVPSFPSPTHDVPEPPSGYEQTRAFARRLHAGDQLELGEPGRSRHFEPPQGLSDPSLPPATSAKEALGDLPPVTPGDDSPEGRVATTLVAAYAATHMRSWPGLQVGDLPPTSHFTRSLGHRDFRLFRRMDADDEYDTAFNMATGLLAEWLNALEGSNIALPEKAPEARRLQKQLIRFRKLAKAKADAQTLANAWKRMRRASVAVDAAYRRYRDGVAALMASLDERYPVEFESRAGLEQRWAVGSRVISAMDGDREPRHHPHLLSTKSELLKELFKYRRTKDAHGRLPQGSLPEPPEDLDLDDHPDLKAIRKRRRSLRDDRDAILKTRRAGGKYIPTDTELAELQLEVLDLTIVRMSQELGVWQTLVAAVVPPYDPCKFSNKWRKMRPDRPTRTLMAHLGKDCYTHIHYDSDQARTITIREAARLQSFPDGFEFPGAMNPAYRQIGNAVPPLLSFAVARRMAQALEGLRLRANAAAG